MFTELLTHYLAALDRPYIAGEEAPKFRAWLSERHPEVLEAWRVERELVDITRAIGEHDRRHRHRSRRRAFAEAVEAADAGDVTAMSTWRDEAYVVSEENIRVRVPDMTKEHWRYVAGTYEAEGNRALMFAAFAKAMADKVPVGMTTGEIMGQDEFDQIRRDLVPAA